MNYILTILTKQDNRESIQNYQDFTIAKLQQLNQVQRLQMHEVKNKIAKSKRRLTYKQLENKLKQETSDKLELKGKWMQILNNNNWEYLNCLYLQDCGVSDENIKNITAHDWNNLRQLGLHQNQITEIGIQIIVSKHWPLLNLLKLSDNEVKDEGLKLLATHKNFPKLSILIMKNAGITYQGINYFLLCPFITNLYHLCLQNNQIGSKGMRILAKLQFVKLQILILNNCKIGSEGSRIFTKINSPNLKQLQIGNNKMALDGYDCLYKKYCKALHKINFYAIKRISVLQISAINWMKQDNMKQYLSQLFKKNP